jgi:hypothetical protein
MRIELAHNRLSGPVMGPFADIRNEGDGFAQMRRQATPQALPDPSWRDIEGRYSAGLAALHRRRCGENAYQPANAASHSCRAAAVTPDMALRLGKFCGNGPALWLGMQQAYDLWQAEERLRAEIKSIETARAA